LIEELVKFPEEAICHAYEGEITGIVIQQGTRHGVIHCGERAGEEPATELFQPLEP
jgi:hypothetical protein